MHSSYTLSLLFKITPGLGVSFSLCGLKCLCEGARGEQRLLLDDHVHPCPDTILSTAFLATGYICSMHLLKFQKGA